MTHCARSFTVCGTTDYMAPETIRGIGSGYSADWCASCAFRNRPRVLQSCQCR